MSPSVTRRLIAEFAARPENRTGRPDGLDELTDREREVVALVAGGLSNEEIAEALVISPATARTHVSRAMIKLGAPRPRPARGHRLRDRPGAGRNDLIRS